MDCSIGLCWCNSFPMRTNWHNMKEGSTLKGTFPSPRCLKERDRSEWITLQGDTEIVLSLDCRNYGNSFKAFLCFFPQFIDSKSTECPIEVNIRNFAIYLLFSCACVGGASVLDIPSCPTMRIRFLQLCLAALALQARKMPNNEVPFQIQRTWKWKLKEKKGIKRGNMENYWKNQL